MSAKHTPGPWRLNETGNVESDAVHNIAVVFSAATQENWGGSDFDTLEHCEANARLIAAAPEMLAAIDEFLAAYQGEPSYARQVKCGLALESLRMSRAKATGEQS